MAKFKLFGIFVWIMSMHCSLYGQNGDPRDELKRRFEERLLMEKNKKKTTTTEVVTSKTPPIDLKDYKKEKEVIVSEKEQVHFFTHKTPLNQDSLNNAQKQRDILLARKIEEEKFAKQLSIISKVQFIIDKSSQSESKNDSLWNLVDMILETEGTVNEAIIDMVDSYLKKWEGVDRASLRLSTNKLMDVVETYNYEKTRGKLAFQGRWWSVKRFKSLEYNPQLPVNLCLNPEPNGELMLFPVEEKYCKKSDRFITSPSSVRYRNSPVYNPENGRIEMENEETDDGRRTLQHYGCDIGFNHDISSTPPIRAAKSGVVVYAGYNVNAKKKGYGHVVVIAHNEDNTLTTLYAHLSSYNVKVGQTVKAGDVIARGGKSGSDAYHLHFEVNYYDMPLDPETFFRCRKETDGLFRDYYADLPMFGVCGPCYVISGIVENKNTILARQWEYSFEPESVYVSRTEKGNGVQVHSSP
jgi:hypothetical protein